MSRVTLDSAALSDFRLHGFHILWRGFPSPSANLMSGFLLSSTPLCSHNGLGSCDFARRYFRNRFFFLFLRLLRCFSSAGSLRMTMDSSYGTWSLSMWVSPFGYLRLTGYVLLTAAFRSLSRPSSAPSARASTLRSFCLTALTYASVHTSGFLLVLSFFRPPHSLGKPSMSSYPTLLS